MPLSRSIRPPKAPEERIDPAFTSEVSEPITETVEQTEISDYGETIASIETDLRAEADAWDSLFKKIEPYVKLSIPVTPTQTVTLGMLASSLANADPRYPDYTEEWQSEAYQNGDIRAMLGQVIVDVRQELVDSLDSWKLILTKEMGSGITSAGSPSPAPTGAYLQDENGVAYNSAPDDSAAQSPDVKAILKSISAQVELINSKLAQARPLRSRVESALASANLKTELCLFQKVRGSLEGKLDPSGDQLRKLAKLAGSLRNFLRVSVLLRTTSYTQQWSSLSDILEYHALKMLTRQVVPMLSKFEARLCEPLYDVIEEMHSISQEGTCGAFDELLGIVLEDMEKAKRKVVDMHMEALLKTTNRFDKRASIVNSAEGRTKITKFEVVLDKILEIAERAAVFSDFQDAADSWVRSHYPNTA